jgi:Tol biopolymer transport system component
MLALAAVVGTIVFWNDQPHPIIWSVPADGGTPAQVVKNDQNQKRPRLSPDGRWIAFDGTPPGKPPMSDFDVQIVRVDGTGLQTLASTPDWDVDAQWSPNGRWLSFTRNPPSPTDCRKSWVWIVHPDGSGARRVAPGCGARWAPDGARLALTGRDGSLRVVTVTTGAGKTLRRSTNWLQPGAWSRDGKRLLYTSLTTGGSGTIFIADASGRHARRLAAGIAACFSPDGRRILYTEQFMGPLFTMRLDGTHRTQLLAVNAAEPDWR